MVRQHPFDRDETIPKEELLARIQSEEAGCRLIESPEDPSLDLVSDQGY